MTREIILERLSHIKYLYQLGEQQSQQPYRVAFSSILCFHDAIDLFNQLVAEFLRKTDSERKAVSGGKRTNLFMMEYFDLIPELTMKSLVKKVNDRRNSLKHNGEIPSPISIEESKTISKLFFEENTELIFKENFNEISLLNLVINQKVQELLISAESHLRNSQFPQCAEETAKAFYELTFIESNDYRGDKYGYYLRHRISKPTIPSVVRDLDRRFERVFEKYNDNFQTITDSLLVISLGIDYREYVKFELLTPEVHINYGEEKYIVYANRSEDKLNAEKCRFLIEFVLECALKVQTFKY